MFKDDSSLQNYKEQMSKHMVTEVLQFLEKQKQDHGIEVSKQLSISFLACVLGALIMQVLNEKPKKKGYTGTELYNFTSKNFATYKLEIQDAVAAGFQGAFNTFSGRTVEYYCQVKPVSEPVNKRPC